ncbi:methyl-accepting chemotaxis protein [Vibrio astriarenae]|nr:methyl-accepting chemotaxis protein [Vibrio sp. C7]
MTEPYIDESTKDILLSISRPVMLNGELQGVIFLDVDLSNLATTVNEAKVPYSSLFIIHKNGSIIGHPQESLNGKNLSEYLPNDSVSLSQTTVDIQQEEHYLQFVEVPNTDWYLGMTLSYAQTHTTLNDMLVSSVTSALLMQIGYFVVFTFVLSMLLKPLKLLDRAMLEIAEGNGI